MIKVTIANNFVLQSLPCNITYSAIYKTKQKQKRSRLEMCGVWGEGGFSCKEPKGQTGLLIASNLVYVLEPLARVKYVCHFWLTDFTVILAL